MKSRERSDEQGGRRKAESNAGAFLGPFLGVVPVPTHPADPLSDAPPEPDDPAQPAREQPERSLADRLLGRNPPPPKDL